MMRQRVRRGETSIALQSVKSARLDSHLVKAPSATPANTAKSFNEHFSFKT